MSRLSKLHKNPKHELAENTPFIKRLRFKLDNEKPSRLDCVNLMQQYFHLYSAMETRLAQLNAPAPLAFFNHEPWALRSQLLKHDINEMKSLLSTSAQSNIESSEVIYPAMQIMIDEIMQASPVQLMAYYAVRCLADVFGGQHLHLYNQRSFEPKSLTGMFYNSVKSSMRSIAKFINNDELFSPEEDLTFQEAAALVFKNHLDLFKEMEQERKLKVTDSLKVSSSSYSSCLRYGLFTLAAVTGTAVAYIACVATEDLKF